ncbi:MAG: P-II family nitrogen regulator [Candidatus Brocadiaceae bacterium]|nr:P-II family nitrogen regulator [Candidatus Brocadiaceae bacterium]
MKKVEAIIREQKLTAVKEALKALGVSGMTVTEVKGHGTQKGITEVFRDKAFSVDLLAKIKIDVICEDSQVDKITKTIVEAAQTGSIGDGKIFIYNVEGAIRIRTGETEGKAL